MQVNLHNSFALVTASRLLTHIRAELLEGCPNAADLLGQPAVENSLCHRLRVQRLQTAGDSLQQGLVALPADISETIRSLETGVTSQAY